MKLKNSLLASALLATTALSAHAATELTPEQAAALKPYDRVVVTGRFNAIGDAVQAVSRKADKEGAASFYVVDTSDFGSGGNLRVTADFYKENAPQAAAPKNRIIRKTRPLSWNRSIPLPCKVSTAASRKSTTPSLKRLRPRAPPLSLSCARLMLTRAATSVSPLISTKRMPKSAFCKARMRSRPIQKPDAPRWQKAEKRLRKWKFRALRRPQRSVPALA